MLKKGLLLTTLLSSSVLVTGCFSMYYHKTSRETAQQYKTERVVIEQQQDRFQQFAILSGTVAPKDGFIQKYYILGERYIYELPYTRTAAVVLAQQLDPRYFKVDTTQPIQVAMKVDDNPEQYISVRYTLKYLRSSKETSAAEKQLLRTAGFRVHKNEYVKEESLAGRLLQRNEHIKIQQTESQQLNQYYSLQLEFYQEKRVKDGNPVINNMKGYGTSAVLDLITLPVQLLSF